MSFQRKTIDAHIHLYEWFDPNGKTFYEVLDGLKRDTGLEGMCVIADEYLERGGVTQNILTALYKLHDPTAYANGCIVFPSYPVRLPLPEGMDALTQYEELMAIGHDGIKILCKPDIEKLIALPINEPFFEPMFAQAEKDRTPFLWHVADPESFWLPEYKGRNCYSDGTYPSFKTLFCQTFDVLKRHPRLTVTFAHFLFLSDRPEMLEQIFEHYGNVSIDVTPGTEMYVNFTKDLDFYRSFFQKHADRILFGTDATVPENPKSRERIESVYHALVTAETVPMGRKNVPVLGLALPQEATEPILRGNFLRLWGETPKPVDPKALKGYIQKYEHLIPMGKTKEMILQAAREL